MKFIGLQERSWFLASYLDCYCKFLMKNPLDSVQPDPRNVYSFQVSHLDCKCLLNENPLKRIDQAPENVFSCQISHLDCKCLVNGFRLTIDKCISIGVSTRISRRHGVLHGALGILCITLWLFNLGWWKFGLEKSCLLEILFLSVFVSSITGFLVCTSSLLLCIRLRIIFWGKRFAIWSVVRLWSCIWNSCLQTGHWK